MTIAELFVKLGIKGAEETGKKTEGVKDKMKDLKSMSLQAKAAIAALVIGFERLMSQSMKTGTNLSNFNSITGLSTKELQQWQYAAQQAGASGEELMGSVKSVQSAMTSIEMGEGAPKGFDIFAQKVGLDQNRLRDTFYIMEKFQEFARSAPPDLVRPLAGAMGISEGTLAAMQKNMFRPEVFKNAPVYSDKQIEALNKADVMWGNLGRKIQMAMGQFTAANGGKLIKELTKVTDAALKLLDTFQKFGEQIKIFDLITMSFQGWEKILTGIGESVEAFTGLFSDDPEKQKKSKEFSENVVGGAKDIAKGIKEVLINEFSTQEGGFNPGGGGNTVQKSVPALRAGLNPITRKNTDFGSLVTPNVSGGAPMVSKQDNKVQQSFIFQSDVKNAQDVGNAAKKGILDAYRQLKVQAQEN